MTIDRKQTKGHAAFLYQTHDERSNVLADYFREGITNNELCIFVTPATEKQVIDDFKAFGFDPTDAIEKGTLRIFEMHDTYLPGGQFVADYMLHNVTDFISDAEAEGYKGLRTAGEMSWLAESPESVADAMKYEADIDHLPADSPSFMGLCLYPIVDGMFSAMLPDVSNTHASLIYDGGIHANPQDNKLFGYSLSS